MNSFVCPIGQQALIFHPGKLFETFKKFPLGKRLDGWSGLIYGGGHMIRFGVLGSGSRGNSAVVSTGGTTVLVDAGLSAKQLGLRMEALGMAADELTGILLTHEHGDHVSGLDVFCRKHDVPVYCNALTREVLVSGPLKRPKRWKVIESGTIFSVSDLSVETFPVAHDATDPVGMVLTDGRTRIGVLSDVGFVTNLMRDQVADCDLLFVEANYDEVLLQNDTKRPWGTKQRIVSRHGHLSNDQTAELVRAVASCRLKTVVLGHLSQDCNTSEIASEAVGRALADAGRPDIQVFCAPQATPLPLIEVEGPAHAEPEPKLAVREEEPVCYQAELFPAL